LEERGLRVTEDDIIDRILAVIEYSKGYSDDFLFKSAGKIDFNFFKECLDEMHYEKLLTDVNEVPKAEFDSQGFRSNPLFITLNTLTIKGKKIKDNGGWVKHKRIQNLKTIAKWGIAILTLAVTGIGVFLQVYYSDPTRKQHEGIDTNNKPTREERTIPTDTLSISEKDTLQDFQLIDSLR